MQDLLGCPPTDGTRLLAEMGLWAYQASLALAWHWCCANRSASAASVQACSVRAQNGHVPAKLNTVIQPLMGGLRREADAVVREAVVSAVAQLVSLCTDRKPSPNDRQYSHRLAASVQRSHSEPVLMQ